MIREHTLPSLRDIVAPGPVERGLYLIDKAPDTASRLLDRIVDLLWWDSVAMPGVMPSRVAAWMNGGRPASARNHRRQSRIGALHWIDTGRLFNPDALQSQSRLRGLDGARVARAIRLQAPVSGEQYLAALERVPNAALCALGENERPSAPTAFGRGVSAGADVRPPSSVWWTPLVVISDLFSPLTDRALPYVDRAEVVERVLERLQHLRERAVVIAFVGHDTASDRLVSQEILKMGTRIVADRREALHAPTVPLRVPAEALH
jgi:hypothetical protein